MITFSEEKVVEINSCRNIVGISLIVLTFILAQTILVITFACLWSAKKRDKSLANREWPQSHLITTDNYNPGHCNEFMYPSRKHYWKLLTKNLSWWKLLTKNRNFFLFRLINQNKVLTDKTFSMGCCLKSHSNVC